MTKQTANRIKGAIGHERVPTDRWFTLIKRMVLGGLCLTFAWLSRDFLGVVPSLSVGGLGLLLIDGELVVNSAMAGLRPLRAFKKAWKGEDGKGDAAP